MKTSRKIGRSGACRRAVRKNGKAERRKFLFIGDEGFVKK
jgi:hypothetical protein